MKKIWTTTFLWLIAVNMLRAQDNRKEASDLMQQLLTAYRSTPYLSFDIRYSYAAENEPSVLLDSLSGTVKLHGNSYWYNMNHTEAICTQEYQIMLFQEDNVMYLSKPSIKANAALPNPVGLLDSLLWNNKDINVTVRAERNTKVIVICFLGNAAYRKIEYHVDNQTGLLKKTINVVRADEMYEPSDRGLLDGAVGYAIVEAVYDNYSRADFDLHMFDSTHYFLKQGAEYTAVAPFDSYKIFLGTPNL